MIDLNIIVDKLLDMKPDPIPEFILLKEFKGFSLNSREYQNAYDRVCNHLFVKEIENEQNHRGFWPPFHGYSEHIIRRCLSLEAGTFVTGYALYLWFRSLRDG